jgi:3-oxoacyl-(acyl-carrier-protein) synthase/pyruvate/2-oxoglutarate dehydrogenase complex dihydrolipoamide acyltransferase (E2) component/acyl carrier protein
MERGLIKQLVVPQINVNDAEATIVAWNVPSGTRVERTQPVAVLETNKSAQDIEAEEDGYLYYRHELNATVAVGELLAVISASPLDEAQVAQALTRAEPASSAPAPAAAEPAPAESEVRSRITAKAQKLIERHGVSASELPASGKITVEVVEQILARRSARPSATETAPVAQPASVSPTTAAAASAGQLAAASVAPAAPPAAQTQFTAGLTEQHIGASVAEGTSAAQTPSAAVPAAQLAGAAPTAQPVPVAPVARSTPTPEAQPVTQPAPAAARAATSSGSRGVPDYLVELETSKQKREEAAALAASYHEMVLSEVSITIDASRCARRLEQLSSQLEFPFTLGDLACHACAQLLGRYPELNGYFHLGRAYRHTGVNVGYALNLGKGLRVPVVRDADRRELTDIAQALRDFILRYSRDELANRDCSRGSFTITDLSTSGVHTFRPVVSPMQSAILGLAKQDGAAVITLILAFDHRMADGLLAARFLNELKTHLEAPAAPEEAGSDVTRSTQSPSSSPEKDAELRKLLLDLKEQRVSYAAFRRKARWIEESGTVYPLSEGQMGLWVMQKLTPTFSAYNIPICFEWPGDLDTQRLQEAVNCVLEQFPVLANVMVEKQGKLIQYANRNARVELQTQNMAGESRESLLRRLREIARQPFSLESGPLLRVHVITSAPQEHVLLIVVHHAICDGLSCGMLLHTLLDNYQVLAEGREPSVQPAAASFRDFVEWESRWLQDESAVNAAWSYWQAQLAAPLPEGLLPTDRPRGAMAGFRGESIVVPVRADVCERIQAFAASHHVKPSAVYLGLFKLLLHAVSGERDIIVGMPIGGRPVEAFQRVFGNFINMIALRSAVVPTQPVREFLKQLQEILFNGMYHGTLPFQQVVKRLGLARSGSYSPLFRTAFMYHELQRGEVPEGMPLREVVGLVQEGQYELTLEIRETALVPRFYWKYDPDLFDAASIRQLAELFEGFAENLPSSKERPLADLVRLVCGDLDWKAGRHTGSGVVDQPSAAEVEELEVEVEEQVPAQASAESAHALAEIRQKVTEIWRDVLGAGAVSANKGFFESGGSSLTSVLVVDRISRKLGCDFSIASLFKYPTIEAIAAYIAKATGKLAPAETPRKAATVVRRVKSRAQGVSQQGSQRSPAAPTPAHGSLPVAIIGMSGCFPGAADLDAFWENLRQGRDCIAEIPAERWDWRELDDADPAAHGNRTAARWGAFIEGVDRFDPSFFGISADEGRLTDPQQRLLLMHAWKAVEDAGYAPGSLSGSRTAVFIGTANTGYSELLGRAGVPIDALSSVSAIASVGPSRVSYLLNLHGPSEPIETACSSSLVAIHRAVRAMQTGDCDMALVGGINTILTPWGHITFGKAGILSDDGRCRTFSKDANGYARGEGAGVLFLKPLADAERDGDPIYGVIRGTGENHGGRASALTAPNPRAQTELIHRVLQEAGVEPDTVGYVEVHGTATALGDAIEIEGLKGAFDAAGPNDGGKGEREATCGLGSVKSNIGHLELAAGAASVIKVLLQLQHRTLVKSLHCEEISPHLRLQGSPFFVVKENRPWRALRDGQGRELPRRAGVSSFGFGGVNAHVLLEEYRAPESAEVQAERPQRPAIVVLSARTAERLNAQARRLLAHLEQHACEASSLADIAYTLQVGRDPMEHRLAFVASSLAELKQKLRRHLDGDNVFQDIHRGEAGADRNAVSLFNEDPGLQDVVLGWIEQGQFARALELWVKGMSIDWTRLYGTQRPRRVRLPTYPFAEERHWVDAGSQALSRSEVAGEVAQTDARTSAASLPAAAATPGNAAAASGNTTAAGRTAAASGSTAGAAGRAVAASGSPLGATGHAAAASGSTAVAAGKAAAASGRTAAAHANPNAASPAGLPAEEAEAWVEEWSLVPSDEASTHGAAAFSPRQKIEIHLQQHVARLLGCEPGAIGRARSFTEMGVSSLGLVELVSGVERTLKRSLSPALLFQYPTFNELASHLSTEYARELAALGVNRTRRRKPARAPAGPAHLNAEPVPAEPMPPESAPAESMRADAGQATAHAAPREVLTPMPEPERPEERILASFRKGIVSIDEMLALVTEEGAVH